jgi:hypothetical protein
MQKFLAYREGRFGSAHSPTVDSTLPKPMQTASFLGQLDGSQLKMVQ